MNKKNCMFQCALQKISIFGYVPNSYEIVEDTGLITWDEAVQLWEKWKPKVIAQLNDEQSPEMIIWTDCKDTTSYSNDLFHISGATQVKNGEFIEVIEKKINPASVSLEEQTHD